MDPPDGPNPNPGPGPSRSLRTRNEAAQKEHPDRVILKPKMRTTRRQAAEAAIAKAASQASQNEAPDAQNPHPPTSPNTRANEAYHSRTSLMLDAMFQVKSNGTRNQVYKLVAKIMELSELEVDDLRAAWEELKADYKPAWELVTILGFEFDKDSGKLVGEWEIEDLRKRHKDCQPRVFVHLEAVKKILDLDNAQTAAAKGVPVEEYLEHLKDTWTTGGQKAKLSKPSGTAAYHPPHASAGQGALEMQDEPADNSRRIKAPKPSNIAARHPHNHTNRRLYQGVREPSPWLGDDLLVDGDRLAGDEERGDERGDEDEVEDSDLSDLASQLFLDPPAQVKDEMGSGDEQSGVGQLPDVNDDQRLISDLADQEAAVGVGGDDQAIDDGGLGDDIDRQQPEHPSKRRRRLGPMQDSGDEEARFDARAIARHQQPIPVGNHRQINGMDADDGGIGLSDQYLGDEERHMNNGGPNDIPFPSPPSLGAHGGGRREPRGMVDMFGLDQRLFGANAGRPIPPPSPSAGGGFNGHRGRLSMTPGHESDDIASQPDIAGYLEASRMSSRNVAQLAKAVAREQDNLARVRAIARDKVASGRQKVALKTKRHDTYREALRHINSNPSITAAGRAIIAAMIEKNWHRADAIVISPPDVRVEILKNCLREAGREGEYIDMHHGRMDEVGSGAPNRRDADEQEVDRDGVDDEDQDNHNPMFVRQDRQL